MSLSTSTLKRLPIIKRSLRKGLNREQIGAKCAVNEKTIDRDMTAWVASGLFEIWLKEEFVDLHNYVRDANPIEAYKQITKIISKMMTQKIEQKTEIKEKVDVNVNIRALLERYETIIERAANRNIQTDNTTEQVAAAHSDTSTN